METTDKPAVLVPLGRCLVLWIRALGHGPQATNTVERSPLQNVPCLDCFCWDDVHFLKLLKKCCQEPASAAVVGAGKFCKSAVLPESACVTMLATNTVSHICGDTLVVISSY